MGLAIHALPATETAARTRAPRTSHLRGRRFDHSVRTDHSGSLSAGYRCGRASSGRVAARRRVHGDLCHLGSWRSAFRSRPRSRRHDGVVAAREPDVPSALHEGHLLLFRAIMTLTTDVDLFQGIRSTLPVTPRSPLESRAPNLRAQMGSTRVRVSSPGDRSPAMSFRHRPGGNSQNTNSCSSILIAGLLLVAAEIAAFWLVRSAVRFFSLASAHHRGARRRPPARARSHRTGGRGPRRGCARDRRRARGRGRRARGRARRRAGWHRARPALHSLRPLPLAVRTTRLAFTGSPTGYSSALPSAAASASWRSSPSARALCFGWSNGSIPTSSSRPIRR